MTRQHSLLQGFNSHFESLDSPRSIPDFALCLRQGQWARFGIGEATDLFQVLIEQV